MPKKTAGDPGSATSSKRKQLIDLLGEMALKDVKSTQELEKCAELRIMLIGEPRRRGKNKKAVAEKASTVKESKPAVAEVKDEDL